MVDVLIVEDDPIFARVLKAQLAALADPKCVVAHAPTLAAALAHLRDARVDVVLSDLGLPDSQGQATVDALKRAAPKVPLVILSGAEDPPRGADMTLLKGGIGGAELAGAIKKVLDLE